MKASIFTFYKLEVRFNHKLPDGKCELLVTRSLMKMKWHNSKVWYCIFTNFTKLKRGTSLIFRYSFYSRACKFALKLTIIFQDALDLVFLILSRRCKTKSENHHNQNTIFFPIFKRALLVSFITWGSEHSLISKGSPLFWFCFVF